MSEATPPKEGVNDFKERAEAFMKEYGELVAKHGVDFASYPVWAPNKDLPGSFITYLQMTPVDTKNQPVASPFVAKE